MTNEDYSKVPPPHLLKKFSEQAREDSKKRGHAGYCKTFAKLCIDWALNFKPSSNHRPIRSSNITPPPELIDQWFAAWESGEHEELSFADFVIPRAAQWGADQELDACCEFVGAEGWTTAIAAELRAARRPKPPSLKEQALDLLDKAEDPSWDINDFSIVRRALEQLPDSEPSGNSR